jgi:hypothetical protein
VLAAALALFSSGARAQDEFNHPELDWKTIETDHFRVHYHTGAERTAAVVAKIAEDVYAPVTSLYNHEPDQKVSFIIKDYDDISNGAAYFYNNKIEIYAPSMDFDFRGTHNWLRNVVTHEFTHIVQIQTSMKFGRTIPAFYFQWLGYESERRPDVLYGYPNIIVSTPYSGFVVPAWFAEGVAQYNRKELRYDFWDTHRDMILRSYVLDGNMLSWDEMSVFGKTSLGNESSYNAGFAFVHYLAQRYGEEKLAEISRNLSSFSETTVDGAIERAVGRNGRDVYEDWKELLEEDYATRVAPVKARLQAGEMLALAEPDDMSAYTALTDPDMHSDGLMHVPRERCCMFNAQSGFANLFPRYSPDGNHIAFVSTKDGDYFSQSSLYIRDLSGGEDKRLVDGVRTAPAWSPDGRKLFYGKSTRSNPHWSYQFDLYMYDLDDEEEKRITDGARALSPAVSPDGSRLVFISGKDGTTNLMLCAADGTGLTAVTSFKNGEQAYNPQWSPDGEWIVFDYSVRDGRDIAVIRPDGSDLRFLIDGEDDSRSPVFTPDGKEILFASDRTGIFNLYSYNMETAEIRQLTNVLGGAFMPSVNRVGEIVYAGYTSGGYKLHRLSPPEPIFQGEHDYIVSAMATGHERSGPLAMAGNGVTTSQFDWTAMKSYDDTGLNPSGEAPYKSKFTSLGLVPFIRVDNYNPKNTALELVKAGVYLFANDILDNTGFFAGVALNTKLERDLFLNAYYRGKIPGLYHIGLEPTASVELYNVTRETGNYLTLGVDTVPVDVTYNLLEFDFVLSHPFVSQFSNVEFRYIHSRYTSILESFVLPATGSLVPASSDLYLIGNDLSMTFEHKGIVPSRTSAINPIGRKVALRVGMEFNKFNGDGEYTVNTSGGLSPVYKDVDFPRVELRWREYLPIFIENHTLTLSLRGGSIIGPAVDEFFDFYAGGLPGMKGYPFYSLGGNEFAMAGLAYRFPLISSIDMRVFNFYFDKLYMSLYADYGDAWTGDVPAFKNFKADAGMELRLESFSFYSFPTRIFFNATYGFDEFTKFISSQNTYVTYGQDWNFHFGILFDFEID